jgi:hypothetical protein
LKENMTARLTAWECRKPTKSQSGVLRLTIEIDASAANDFLEDLDARRVNDPAGDAIALKALLADLHWHLLEKK